MTEQTPGNRREPTDSEEPTTAPRAPGDPAASRDPGRPGDPADSTAADPVTVESAPATPAPTGDSPTAGPSVPGRSGRWRALVGRPGRERYLAAGLAGLVVLVGLGGFLVGRASVDEGPGPIGVSHQWRHGPVPGGVPDRPFDGDRGPGPGFVPGAPS